MCTIVPTIHIFSQWNVEIPWNPAEVTNLSLVSWFFLIFFPRWRKLQQVVLIGPMVNAVVYAAVAVLAARNPHAPAVDFSSLEGRRLMSWEFGGEAIESTCIHMQPTKRIHVKASFITVLALCLLCVAGCFRLLYLGLWNWANFAVHSKLGKWRTGEPMISHWILKVRHVWRKTHISRIF